jgi:hypothetical protein
MKITIKLDERVFEGEVSEVEVAVQSAPVEPEPVITDVETEPVVEPEKVEVAPEEVIAEPAQENA